MNRFNVKRFIRAVTLAGIYAVTASSVAAQGVQHLTVPQPGGMPGMPVMTGLTRTTNGVALTWDGPSGYYQIFQKSNNFNAPWVALGKNTNLTRIATITRLYSNAFYKVSGPAPKYAGAKACITCHASVCRYETNTPHAFAWSNPAFKAAGGWTNTSCLVCHTVGYGLATGFNLTNRNGFFTYATNLAGVQCENCHGPAANHASAPDDPTLVPRVELAAEMCGGCHSGTMNPTYDGWKTSGHAAVVPHVLDSMASSTNSITSCGVCHSGSARLELINGRNPAITMTKDYNVAVTCAVCHNPHATNSNPVLLRNPMASTNSFHFLSSDVASISAFTNKYNASTDINLCAQCHNDRGAAWTDTSRAPHHSLQYNFLLGAVGELQGGSATFNPGTHAGLPASAIYSISGTFYLTNQCAACHMQPDAAPATTHSHTFTPGYDVCMNCHDGAAAQDFFTPYLSNRVASVIFALNQWAALKAPSTLKSNGIVPWEYTTPGGLTWTTNSSGYVTGWTESDSVSFKGPNSTGQALIPDTIKKARFNLYLVVNDGSEGAHNPSFAIGLLSSAQTFVIQELNK